MPDTATDTQDAPEMPDLSSLTFDPDQLPEELRGFAEETEGGRLRLAGLVPADRHVPKARLNEFRENNRRLHREAEELREKLAAYEGLDPEKAREAERRLRDLEDEQVAAAAGLTKDELEERLQKRTEKMRADGEAQRKALSEKLKATEEKLEEAHRQHAQYALKSSISGAAAKVDGFRSAAVEDAQLLAQTVFQLNAETGDLEPRDANGDLMIGADGTSPMTPEEWLRSVVEQRPHWVAANTGGAGASRNGAGSGRGAYSPDAFEDMSMAAYRAARKAGKVPGAAPLDSG